MRVTYGSLLLASENLALGRVGSGAAYGGDTITDEVQFFRASHATIYGRARGPRRFSLRVWRLFAEEAAALAFAHGHEDSMPLQDTLTLVDDAATIALTMGNAVGAARIVERRGTAVLVEYTFTGARFESSGEVPDIPEEDNALKVGVVDLSENDESKAVSFPTPFGAAPRSIQAIISRPSGGFVVSVAIAEESITASGFTAVFGGAIPGSGYKLRYHAIL